MSELASEVDVGPAVDARPDAVRASMDDLLCACGSGLHADRCCRMALAGLKPAEPSPGNRARLAALGAARNAADVVAATAIALEILSAQPAVLEALAALFLIRRHEGNRTAARALIERLVALVPHEARFSTYLVDGLVDDGNWPAAEATARNAVRLAPAEARAHDTLGFVLSQQQKLPEGEFHLRRALALGQPRTVRLLMQLARNLQTQGQLDEARELIEESMRLEPEAAGLALDMAALERAAGRFEAAAGWLERAAQRAPSAPGTSRQRAWLAYDSGDFAAALDVLQKAFPEGAECESGDLYLFGQTLDRLGRYDEAFGYFEAANRAQMNVAGKPFNLDALRVTVEGARQFMTARTMSLLPRAPLNAGQLQPLFIVGFGRSGTTMLEQSLSMHPDIVAAGELTGMGRLVLSLQGILGSPIGYPGALSELWAGDRHDQIGLLRDYYLNVAKRFLPKDAAGRWFTDKALAQEQHLGLVHLLFPQSPIVHLIRHPLDVVVSTYANALPHGGYSGGVEEAARYYLLLLESAEHFVSVIPELRYMRVRYEDVLDDQERWTREILAFAGEPFDPACLRFHENTRHARTLSLQQVREKMHTRSRFRYRHYLHRLGPAIEVLGPAIERLGYCI